MPRFTQNDTNNLIIPTNYKRPNPTQMLGSSGTAIFGGYVERNEASQELNTHDSRYRLFSNMLANTSIVSAGVRYFLNLIGSSKWSVKPAEVAQGDHYAELTEKMLFKDAETPWARVIRRASMYTFYGFSVQEWQLRPTDEGNGRTFADIAPRPQSTIRRWHADRSGKLMGAIQTDPQTEEEIFLPRPKIMYVVDDTLDDSPEGFGLFRHLAQPARTLERYEQLEGFGFETDIRGMPIARIPYAMLNKMEQEGLLTPEQKKNSIAALRRFIQKHIREPSLGITLDSATYRGEGEGGSVSGTYLWDLQTLKGSATSFKETAEAIERINREIARILGVEQLLLGSNSVGSYALSKDKTNAFHLSITATLDELTDVVHKDLMRVLWKYNGWPMEAMPEVVASGLDHKDFTEVAIALRELATAGAVLVPGDPAIEEVRAMMGVPPPDEASIQQAKELLQPPQMEQQGDPEMEEIMKDVAALYEDASGLPVEKDDDESDVDVDDNLSDDELDDLSNMTDEEFDVWLEENEPDLELA